MSDYRYEDAIKQLQETGISKAGGRIFRPGGNGYVDIYDRDNNFVTDTESVRKELEDIYFLPQKIREIYKELDEEEYNESRI